MIGFIQKKRAHEPVTGRKAVRLSGILLCFLPLFGSMIASPVSGAESDNKLTLVRAVQLALEQNPRVQMAAIDRARSEQDKHVALSALMPQVQAEVTETALRGNFEAFTGRTIEGFPKVIGPFSVFQGGGNFTVPVFDLTLWRRWQAAGNAVSGAEAQEKSVQEQIVLLVVSQYLGCLRENANVAAIKSRVDLAQALYQLAVDVQATGVGTRIDALRAEVTLQNEKQRLIAAETKSKNSLYALENLLNIDPQKSVELTDTFGFLSVPEVEQEPVLESAYAARPEMRALEARLRELERRKQAAKAARLPSVHTDGYLAYQGLSIDNSIPVYQFQVRVNFPLFTGGRIGSEVSMADMENRKLTQEIQELKNRIALEVKTARASLDSARSEVAVANLGLELAREEIVQARDRFEAGVTNNIEVITAQDELARASDNQINALYRYNQARADLAYAGGQMESLYSK